MHTGSLIFSQLMNHLPMHVFHDCVARHQGNRYIKSFPCSSQFYCMVFAQLTHRESLRNIEVCLRAQGNKVYHMGIRGSVSRATLAHANQKRDWRIYAEFGQELIRIARQLYADEDLGLELSSPVFALDSSTIDLSLSMFPWAWFRKTKSAVKLHTLLDLQGSIPAFIHVTHGKVGDVKVLDLLLLEPGAFYVMDRAYLDFQRLCALDRAGSFYIIRAKKNTCFRRRYSRPVDETQGVLCDQTIVLTGTKTSEHYPQPLRRVKYRDPETGKVFNFLTHNFAIAPATVAELYRHRWAVELFFKWIKQHLRIKSFFGTTENAVKTQIWIAISTYVQVAIVRKRLGIEADLYTILQILSLSLFEKTPLLQLLTKPPPRTDDPAPSNQLILL